MVTNTFWTDGITMTNTTKLGQVLGGLRKEKSNTTKSHWKTILTLQQEKKEVGTRNPGNSLNAEGVQGPLYHFSDSTGWRYCPSSTTHSSSSSSSRW